MKRLFLGIPLSDDFKAGLAKFKEENKRLSGVKWTAYENLHITVLFIGNYDERQIPDAVINLKKIIESIPLFYLKFEKFSLIRFKKRPRMFWAQFQKSVEFDEICTICATLFPGSSHYLHGDNIPHSTLARIKSIIDERDVKYIHEIKSAEVDVTECVLWESVTHSSGPEYRTVAGFSLKKII